MYKLITATVLAASLSFVAFAPLSSAQAAGPVVDTYAINVNGDPAGFVELAKKVFSKSDEIGIKTERAVYVSEIGGTSTNMVYVIIEHASLGAMETALEKLYGTDEWKSFMEATRQKGVKISGRQVLRELYSD
jgi:hypothetical protein